jgi:hypothetical protein
MCGKDIPERVEKINGGEMPFPYCDECEKKMQADYDKMPRRHGKKKDQH